jgi:RNA polymerase sigma-70 factor (ECF subfamily)
MMSAAMTLTGWKFGTKKRTAEDNRLVAFETMVARDWDRFYRYAYRLCGNADDAEDLLSDSLLEAFRIFDRYRGEGFDRWMFRILTTNRIDMARRAKVRRADSLDAGWNDLEGETHSRDISDATANPESLLLKNIYSEDIQRALDALPEDFRAAILLCDVEQMEYQEIADTLHVPIGTVRSRISRGRAMMRRTIEGTIQGTEKRTEKGTKKL